MRLEKLLDRLNPVRNNFRDVEITSISIDSRKIKPNSLFIAWKGVNNDSNQFIEKAIESGVIAVVAEKEIDIPSVPSVFVENGREAYSIICQNYYSNPAKSLNLIGITGTTGKTTIAYLIYKILNDTGSQTGLIGTAGYYSGITKLDTLLKGPVTTPEPMELNHLFSSFLEDGCKNVVLEASSFGLEQKRLFGLNFKIGILSNLSYNHHINYHGGIKDYIRAKEQLFKQIKQDGVGIFNRDSEFFNDFQAKNKLLQTVGIQDCADFMISDFYQSEESGISFSINYDEISYLVTSPFSGFYQAYNLTQAFAACIALGVEPKKIIQSISKINSVPGRWHFIKTTLPFSILIDKANTPIALKNILPLLLAKDYSKRILVFGNVGGGDSLERKMMAKLFYDSFHEIIVTSDDPEDEDPMEGALDFLSGIPERDESRITIELDRKKAIQYALRKATANDLVAILGRGNQREFLQKGVATEFDDIEVTNELVLELEKNNETSR